MRAHAPGDEDVRVLARLGVSLLVVVDEVRGDVDIGAGEVILQPFAQPDLRETVIVSLAHETSILIGIARIDTSAR
jgi:hypothetical protein